MSDVDKASEDTTLKFAAEVLRLNDVLESCLDLADSLEGRAEGDEYSPAEQSAYRVAAQELRAVLEGGEE